MSMHLGKKGKDSVFRLGVENEIQPSTRKHVYVFVHFFLMNPQFNMHASELKGQCGFRCETIFMVHFQTGLIVDCMSAFLILYVHLNHRGSISSLILGTWLIKHVAHEWHEMLKLSSWNDLAVCVFFVLFFCMILFFYCLAFLNSLQGIFLQAIKNIPLLCVWWCTIYCTVFPYHYFPLAVVFLLCLWKAVHHKRCSYSDYRNIIRFQYN